MLSNKNGDALKIIRKCVRILILTELILSDSLSCSIWSSKLAKLNLKRSLNLSVMQTLRYVNICCAILNEKLCNG